MKTEIMHALAGLPSPDGEPEAFCRALLERGYMVLPAREALAQNQKLGKILESVRELERRANEREAQVKESEDRIAQLMRIIDHSMPLNGGVRLRSNEDHPLIAYVAGPYCSVSTWGVSLNIQKAREVAYELWTMGFIAICPHLNSAFMEGGLDNEVWPKGYLRVVELCDIVVIVPGWGKSSGTLAEIEHARKHDRPVLRWPNDLDKLRRLVSPQPIAVPTAEEPAPPAEATTEADGQA